jgi:hypothetical protein
MVDLQALSANIYTTAQTTVGTSKSYNVLVATYRNPGPKLSSLKSQCALAGMTLNNILTVFQTDGEEVARKIDLIVEFKTTLDTTLTGCYIIFFLFGRNLERWNGPAIAPTADMDWQERSEKLEMYIGLVRGLVQSLNLLLSCFHMHVLPPVHNLC